MKWQWNYIEKFYRNVSQEIKSTSIKWIVFVSIVDYRFLYSTCLIFYVFIRYLAGRFPETAHAIDLDGRTPLHYAATLADNGHYYNLLLHLGANPLVQDNVSAILIMIHCSQLKSTWLNFEKKTKDYIPYNVIFSYSFRRCRYILVLPLLFA